MIVPTKLNDLDRFYFHYARDLQRFTDAGIAIRPVEKENGRVGIVIELGENTTARQLRDAEPLAIKWRDRLNEFQGRGILYSPLVWQIVDLLESRKAKSLTYAQIAGVANGLVSKCLRNYLAMEDKDTFKARILLYHVRELLTFLHAGQEDLDRPNKNPERDYRPGPNSKGEEEARQQWITEAIRQGTVDNLVTPQNVKDTVFEWKRKNKRRIT